jgi:hypothetical protein
MALRGYAAGQGLVVSVCFWGLWNKTTAQRGPNCVSCRGTLLLTMLRMCCRGMIGTRNLIINLLVHRFHHICPDVLPFLPMEYENFVRLALVEV